MHIGDLEIHLVSDGQVWVDPGGPFGLVPRALYERVLPPSPDNLVPEMLTCLLLRSGGRTLLVDTGLGTRLDERSADQWHLERPEGGLVDGLARHGVSPEQVDVVINTHLHSDHCAGNTVRRGEGVAPTFPRAEYLVQRMEWADASHPNVRTRATYFSDNFAPLLAEGRLRLLHGDEPITPHVRCVITPGHTRGHQSVLLSSGEWRGLFVSDMATFAVQMARAAWVTSFDVEPLENIATKLRWQHWALETGAWLFFIHDPLTPVARLVERGGRPEIEAVEEARPLIDSLPTRPQPAEWSA
jgi:glyoxylase-like metal-dependent hydrolase (beta-lactamase superfamily II)